MSTRSISWPRIFAEGVAIVASILLAFGIQAWWEGRQDHLAARASLELLARDLSETIEQMREFEGLMDRSASAALTAYAAMSGAPGSLDEDAISDEIIRASSRRTVRIPSAAYTDLLSTGSLRLIENRELRDHIVRFYEAAQRSQDIIAANNDRFLDGLILTDIFGRGLVIPRPQDVRDVGNMTEVTRRLRTALGASFEHPSDPLWELSPSSPEWHQVQGTLLQVAKAMAASGTQASDVIEGATSLQAEIVDALSR